MAQYMVDATVAITNRNGAVKRFTEGGETDNPKTLYDWFLHWNDVVDIRVTPVISDDDAGALFQKHGLSA